MKPFLKVGCLGVIVLIILALVAVRVFMPEEVKKMSAQARQFSANYPDNFSEMDEVHAAFSGNESATFTVFIVHGSPGNWSAGVPYLLDEELTSKAFVVSFDRPGYGKSNPGKTVESFDEQCEKLAAWAESRPGKRIWLGHSFGAPIIANLAVKRPDLVDGLILSASAMDPGLEQPRWFHRFGDSPPGRAFLNSEWRVTNEECIAFADELETLATKLGEITCPVVMMHAKDDSLARFEHMEWTIGKLKSTPAEAIEFETGDHFILWNRVEETKREIFRLMED